jgi:4-diphosphocytidyl-2-C-methyl-D-erythritol kinase
VRAALSVRAYAKINLGLRITRTRADGFHELRTVFQSIDLHDTLTFRRRKGPLVFRCSDADLPVDASNLVVGAARALWREWKGPGEPRDVEMVLDKRIPVGAGLGGGSSDAAAALRGLAAIWRVRWSERERWSLAARLGSDVPYFLCGGAALGLGRGDELYPLADPGPTWVVLLIPRFRVLTADAYRWYDADQTRDEQGVQVVSPPPAGAASASRRLLVTDVWNDLEPPVASRHPEVLEMRRALEAHGARLSAMSGSGSAVYGLFGSGRLAAAAGVKLQRSPWRAIIVRALGGADYVARTVPRTLSRLPPSLRIG